MLTLEFERDCAGFDKSKRHGNADKLEDERKDHGQSEQYIDDGERTAEGDQDLNRDRYHMRIEAAKQKEQIALLQELCQESVTKMSSYEFDIEQLREKNETYESQSDILTQRNACLQAEVTEWKSKCVQSQQDLSSVKEENFALKRELTNLQISYEQDVKHIKNSNSLIILNDSTPNDYLNQELQARIKQNLQLKKENRACLDRLTQLNEKYNDVKSMKTVLQKELNDLKSRAAEMTEINTKHVDEIQFLVNENTLLKQTLNEMQQQQQQTKPLDDANGIAREVSYPLTASTSPRWRTRSHSQGSGISDADSCDSPVVSSVNYNLKFEYEDLYRDDLSEDTPGREDERLFYDVFDELHDHLHVMSDSVRVLKNVQSMHNPAALRNTRAFSSRLGITLPTTLNVRCSSDCDEKKSTEDVWVSNSDVEIDEDEEKAERLLDAINTNVKEERIASLCCRIQQSKECVNELHKQQMVVIATERAKYSDLETAFKHYRVQAKRKMKQLTKDMCKTEYKKYGGYREIAWDLVGNMSNYTKDAIIHKLTH